MSTTSDSQAPDHQTTSSKCYQLLPEWAPQSGVMLTWPHANSDWAPFLTQVEPVFYQIAESIAHREKVLITVASDTKKREIIAHFTQLNLQTELRVFVQETNDTWARDHGPITVTKDDKPLLLDFIFNGWGNKFDARLDTALNRKLAKASAFNCDLEPVDLVLEGGSIESDGHGTLLTTSECLLASTRNPSMDKAAIEALLSETFGLKRTLWLDYGYLAGDDTDSHVDTLARFCDPHTIAYVQCTDESDEHYPALKAMENQLKAFTDYQGQAYKLVPLPMAEPCFSDEGDRLPATYANFLIINGAVLLPIYGNEQLDQQAIEQIKSAFPNHEIIAINCRPIVEQYGSLHCLTMQLPEGVLV
ncbi:agmatine deiminase family protein [Oceanospirillum linum]|uniref:Agmatine deiminase n=1 Tax=Oceanospirillum linum TaxID=966 RepID=A0A1T1HEI2_OCELI|nr:agmatine deiminase family protein [Oceanospirillum linum]OOV88271.1 agmatine deiminase [Oceanospirillum linum]SEF50539.1 agmatine deiminase [Oleiphilus messinensis]SMP03854.1 agmatine deiminase [Oceanospirillum linum]